MDANTAIAIVSILLLVGILISMGIGRLQGEQPPEPVKHLGEPVTSSNDNQPPRTSSEPPQNRSGSPDTTAERTSTGDNQEAPHATLHNHLSRLEMLTLLAVQKDSDGEYLYSANKIADLVGGARQKTLDQIGEERGTRKPEEPPAPQGRMPRPENGWR
jgi:hypothetical protein